MVEIGCALARLPLRPGHSRTLRDDPRATRGSTDTTRQTPVVDTSSTTRIVDCSGSSDGITSTTRRGCRPATDQPGNGLNRKKSVPLMGGALRLYTQGVGGFEPVTAHSRRDLSRGCAPTRWSTTSALGRTALQHRFIDPSEPPERPHDELAAAAPDEHVARTPRPAPPCENGDEPAAFQIRLPDQDAGATIIRESQSPKVGLRLPARGDAVALG
jgi:hypothetical protein